MARPGHNDYLLDIYDNYLQYLKRHNQTEGAVRNRPDTDPQKQIFLLLDRADQACREHIEYENLPSFSGQACSSIIRGDVNAALQTMKNIVDGLTAAQRKQQ